MSCQVDVTEHLQKFCEGESSCFMPVFPAVLDILTSFPCMFDAYPYYLEVAFVCSALSNHQLLS